MTDTAAAATRRWRRLRYALVLLAVALGLWGWLTWRDLSAARTAALAAITESERGADRAAGGDIDGLSEALDRAASDLDEAERYLRRPTVGFLTLVPFATTEVRAARAAVAAADATVAAATDLIGFFEAERAPLLSAGGVDAGALELLRSSVGAALSKAATARELLESAPRARTRSIRDRVERLDEASSALFEGLTGAQVVTDRLAEAVAGGAPYQVLVLFENGAELRGTGGLMGVTALVEVRGGELRLGNAQVIHELVERDDSGEYLAVEAPADYVSRYGEFLANTTLWLNVNMSPDFPTVADIAARLYQRVTGIAPDAVVRIDLVAIGELLAAFPPIELEGGVLQPGELATEFIIDSYRRFPDQDEQGEYFATVIGAVFDHLLRAEGADGSRLLPALRRSMTARHMAAFTGDARIDQALRRLGADGALLPGDPGDVEVVVQNFGANKADLFTDTEITFTTETEGCAVAVETSLTLTNNVPGGMEFLPQGVAGEGSVWWISLHLPRNATLLELTLDGEPAGGVLDEEQGRPVVSMVADTSRGGAVTAVVRWQEQVDADRYRFRVSPQPHIRPAQVQFDDEPPRSHVEVLTHDVPLQCRAA